MIKVNNSFVGTTNFEKFSRIFCKNQSKTVPLFPRDVYFFVSAQSRKYKLNYFDAEFQNSTGFEVIFIKPMNKIF